MMNTLEMRVRRLERANRVLLCMVTVPAIAGAFIVIAGADRARKGGDVQEVVSARRIEVVNEDGKRIVVLGKIADEQPFNGIVISDDEGKARLAASVYKKDAGIFLARYGGGMAASLEAKHNKGGQLAIANADEKKAAVISSGKNGAGIVVVLGHDGKPAGRLGPDEDF